MVKDEQTFGEELWMDLKLQHPDPTSHTGKAVGEKHRRLETGSQRGAKQPL